MKATYVSDLTSGEQLKIAALLKTYFPELGTDNEIEGVEAVQELCNLYNSLPQVEIEEG